MCGIAGIYNYGAPTRPVDRSLLEQMTRTLAHRGPDGEGFFVRGPVGFGHRRLAIVDLTETGSQPMVAVEHGSVITYNGELYNHRDYRPRLEARGVRFNGTSDTETLLQMLAHYGPDILESTAGIFAFGFWDGRHRRLILARDPLGVKQVYVHDDGTRVLFASEIKALLCDPSVRRELDDEGLSDYLHFHTPLFSRTFFRGIRQLQPGEYVEIDKRGMRAHTYWTLDGFDYARGSPEQQVEELRERVAQVVASQLMSDVPVGCFFSGGIDSTAVTAFARKAGVAPKCFGVHFSGQEVIDERPYQESAAKALDVELELMTFDGASFPEDVERLIYQQDQPIIGAAMLPMYYVSRLAAQNVKVCLGGQAGDEIFGGYARYALANPLQVLKHWSLGRAPVASRASTSTLSQRITRRARLLTSGNLQRQLFDLKNLRRLAHSTRYLHDWRRRYFDNFALVPEHAWAELIANHDVGRERAFAIYTQTLAKSAARDAATKLLHWDTQTYLPGLFQQDDRMSMASSLESRVPLADPRLVRHAFRIPFALKFRGGSSKWILRQAVAPFIPEGVLNRRKVGFDTPAVRWMKGQHRDWVHDTLLSAKARSRGYWNAKAVEELLLHPDEPLWFERIWKVLCIETWAHVFLDDSVRETAHVA